MVRAVGRRCFVPSATLVGGAGTCSCLDGCWRGAPPSPQLPRTCGCPLHCFPADLLCAGPVCLQAAKAKQPLKAIEIFEAMASAGVQVRAQGAGRRSCRACRMRALPTHIPPATTHLHPPPTLQPNTFSYSALISALARAGRWQEAERYFADLLSQVRAGRGSVGRGGAAEGRCRLRRGHEAGGGGRSSSRRSTRPPPPAASLPCCPQADACPELAPNTVTYAALISGTNGGRWFGRLRRHGGVLCSRGQAASHAAPPASRSPAPSPPAPAAYEKGGQLGKALEAFREQCEAGVAPDLITYSSLITACQRAGALRGLGWC